jgi:DNA-binding response OmpR family regulator
MTSASLPLILIVDDNPNNHRVLSATLETAGFATANALNAMEALAFLGREKPDLILLDVMMPGMDGYELCQTIKQNIGVKDVPVIFLTARADSDDVLQGFSAGAVDYVAKPFAADELLARVRTHVELKRAREEIKTLRGFIPICSSCKSVRQADDTWITLETFLNTHTDAELSHGVCPTCMYKLYPEIAKKLYPHWEEPVVRV